MSVTFPGDSPEYRAARDRLLAKEIELRRVTEAPAVTRRELPPIRMTVFHRQGDEIRHFWSSELAFAPSDSGQDPRHNGTIEPLWNLFDLIPEGRLARTAGLRLVSWPNGAASAGLIGCADRLGVHCIHFLTLKRHVVVRDLHAAEIVFGRRRSAGSRTAPPAGRTGLVGTLTRRIEAAAFAPAAQQQNFFRYHFGRVDLLAVLVVIAAGLQASFHIDLLALSQVIRQVFLPPEDHVRPVSLFFPLIALLIFPAAGRGDGKTGDRRS